MPGFPKAPLLCLVPSLAVLWAGFPNELSQTKAWAPFIRGLPGHRGEVETLHADQHGAVHREGGNGVVLTGAMGQGRVRQGHLS